ncbi:tRNA preQ1(34) S-adenosylmethionine ribosyltransferase-isomerase QueA [bacterium]|nr:tRNA preQ1(34) S-adenosylmethionine ribosyltransferase-isomerase QueA [bacterium]
MKLSDFDFSLPEGLIAQQPSSIRDHSRLMIVDRKTGNIEEGRFMDIINYLRPGDLMALNDTKVFPARLKGKKTETGGSIEILLINPLDKKTWLCLIKGRVKPGQELIFVPDVLSGTVIDKEGTGKWLVRFEWEGDFIAVLQRYGQVPLPPYIKRPDPSKEDTKRYQTVFAEHIGAVAAPTAGLHFTEELMKKICEKGVVTAFVTLHVGPGTFKPIIKDDILKHKMDIEKYSVSGKDIDLIDTAKKEGRRIIAVGTTTTRALETLYLKSPPPKGSKQDGWTDLFIVPGFHFKIVDALITNFHLPRSTLLVLVCAFSGYDLIMKAYDLAIKKGFRFYSYGDAMLIT